MKAIQIPHDFIPREYQLKAFQAFDAGIKRLLLIWPRRAGKDAFSINLAAKAMYQRVGTVFHFLPTAKQGRKVIWDSINGKGQRVIDQAFPPILRDRIVNDEMAIRLKNGSVYQVVGSDNFDSIVGSNPIGVIFSEWALSDPRAWDYIRPILAENNGFAVFISTPRGRNFMHDQYKTVLNDPEWYVSKLSCEDTGHISQEAIDKERRSGMPESRIQQEFYTSFDASNVGAIYVEWIDALEKAGRIGSVPFDPRYPVELAYDLGHRDATAIWFFQRVGRDIHVIDYFEGHQMTLPKVAPIVWSKGYGLSRTILPHDAEHMEYGAGVETSALFRQYGFNVVIAPKLGLEEGIEATRAMLPRMIFDREKCHKGLTALKHYHFREVEDDDTNKVILSATPNHDWSSHGADALRYFCVTPEGYGVAPQWAMKELEGQRPFNPLAGMGRGTGKVLIPETDSYDPLESYRSASF